jgi:hypothetical protein
MATRNLLRAITDKMNLRARFLLLKIKLQNFEFYLQTGLESALLGLICIHPFILLAALMNFNVIGDSTRNILCMAIFVIDCLSVFIGAIVVDYLRKS